MRYILWFLFFDAAKTLKNSCLRGFNPVEHAAIFYKYKELCRLLLCNGFIKKLFEIFTEEININMAYKIMTHPKTIADLDEFTGHESENEYLQLTISIPKLN
jgi:hypothetical protein